MLGIKSPPRLPFLQNPKTTTPTNLGQSPNQIVPTATCHSHSSPHGKTRAKVEATVGVRPKRGLSGSCMTTYYGPNHSCHKNHSKSTGWESVGGMEDSGDEKKGKARKRLRGSGSGSKPAEKAAETEEAVAEKCSECGKVFFSLKALFGHMKCHPERSWRGINPPTPPPETGGTGSGGANVTTSEKEVADGLTILSSCDPKTLIVADNIHSTPDPQQHYECSKCNKVFDSHQALGGHRASHKNIKGCFAVGREHGGVRVRIGRSGEGLRPDREYKCSVCHKVFSTGQALGGHMRWHLERNQLLGLAGSVASTATNLQTAGLSFSSGLQLHGRRVGLGVGDHINILGGSSSAYSNTSTSSYLVGNSSGLLEQMRTRSSFSSGGASLGQGWQQGLMLGPHYPFNFNPLGLSMGPNLRWMGGIGGDQYGRIRVDSSASSSNVLSGAMWGQGGSGIRVPFPNSSSTTTTTSMHGHGRGGLVFSPSNTDQQQRWGGVMRRNLNLSHGVSELGFWNLGTDNDAIRERERGIRVETSSTNQGLGVSWQLERAQQQQQQLELVNSITTSTTQVRVEQQLLQFHGIGVSSTPVVEEDVSSTSEVDLELKLGR